MSKCALCGFRPRKRIPKIIRHAWVPTIEDVIKFVKTPPLKGTKYKMCRPELERVWEVMGS